MNPTLLEEHFRPIETVDAICIKCKYYRVEMYPRCLARAYGMKYIHPVTGSIRYWNGKKLVSSEHPFCIDCNEDGQCKLYEVKNEADKS